MMLRAAILFYIGALFSFYTYLALGKDYTDWVYYIWDKTAGGSFMSWCVIYSITIRDRQLVAPLVWFSLFRALWDIISLKTGITAANDWRIASLFVFLTIATGVMAFRSKGHLSISLNNFLKRIKL